MKWKEWTIVADNEDYWREREEKGIIKAEYVRDYILRLWFEDKLDISIYELDFYPLIVEGNPGGLFLLLKDKERFRLVTGDYALIWFNPNTQVYDTQTIDIAPESIRFFCEKYGKKITNLANQRVI